MSGVQVGTRLEQLERLHRRIAYEIAVERAREADASAGRVRRPEPKSRTRGSGAVDMAERLRSLGITSHEVKTWALGAGLVDRIARGIPSRALVDAYLIHQQYADPQPSQEQPA